MPVEGIQVGLLSRLSNEIERVEIGSVTQFERCCICILGLGVILLFEELRKCMDGRKFRIETW